MDHIKILQDIFIGFCTVLAYRATYSKTWRNIPILGRTGPTGANLSQIVHTRL